MKKIFKNYYLSIKDKYNLESKTILFEGILLVLISTLCLIFNRIPKELTILYIFPISILLISIEKLVYADHYKELDNKTWMVIVAQGLLYLLFTFYLVINPIKDAYQFLLFLSSFMIFNSLTKIITKNKVLLNYIDISIVALINLLIIIFNEYVLNDLYLYLIISYLIYGLIKVIIYFILNKINKK